MHLLSLNSVTLQQLEIGCGGIIYTMEIGTCYKSWFVCFFPPAPAAAAAAAKSLQLCPTLCNPIPGTLQARTLEWVAISFSNA